MINFSNKKRQKLSGVLGLALDGSRMEVAVLRRTNGSLQVQQTFAATLSLDPLTNDPELVGREIRNHLEAAGVRERYCIVGVPVKWTLIVHTKIPEMPEEDIANFLQIEAERGFPCDVETLQIATSRYEFPDETRHATMLGIPKNHLNLMEQVLKAAQLKVVSFSLGIAALQPANADSADGVLALVIGEGQVGLQITFHGGVASLRTLEGAMENKGGQASMNAEVVAREARITLGQLAPEFRENVRRIRIFGPRDMAKELATDMESRFAPAGLRVEVVAQYAAREFGLHLPPNVAVSSAFSLAAWYLANEASPFEFLAPKVSSWQKLAARYSSGSLQRAGIAAGILLFAILALFGFQQWRLWRLQSQWTQMGPKVHELEALQQKIRQLRPWFEESQSTLSILRQVTEAFPEDGVVSAKTVEIRDQVAVTCAGIARNNQALLKTMEQLGTNQSIVDLKRGPIRGTSPMQFSFDFHWRPHTEK